jgi:hypothetical protein
MLAEGPGVDEDRGWPATLISAMPTSTPPATVRAVTHIALRRGLLGIAAVSRRRRVGAGGLGREAEDVLLAAALRKRQRPLVALVRLRGLGEQVAPAHVGRCALKLAAIDRVAIVAGGPDEIGRLVHRGRPRRERPRVGDPFGIALHRDDPAAIQLLTDRGEECLRGALPVRRVGHDLEAGHNPWGGGIRERGIPFADDLRPGIGGDRPELRPADRNAVTSRILAPGEHAVGAGQASAGQEP